MVASLPIKPFTTSKAARIWKKTEREARKILDSLAGRSLPIDSEIRRTSVYSLPPPMAGMFEFLIMRGC